MVPYIVKNGDYPWKLAQQYTGDGNRWKELCNANPQLPKHATYGCIFTVGKEIMLPDSWTGGTTSITAGPTTATVTTDAGSGILNFLGIKPSTTTVNLSTTGQQTTMTASSVPSTASAATAAQTTPNGTAAPAATTAVITETTPVSSQTATNIKYGLIAAGIIAVGVIAYLGLTAKDEAPKMATNGRRRRGRKSDRRSPRRGRRRMRRNMKIKVSKAFVVDEFTTFVYPTLPHKDPTAVRTAWNDFVEGLRRSGNITDNQAETWDQPAWVKKGTKPPKRKS